MNIVQIQYVQSIWCCTAEQVSGCSAVIRIWRLRVRVSPAVLFFFFFLKNKVFKYFSASFPCKGKLSFYPNNYTTSADPDGGGGGGGGGAGGPTPWKITSYMGFYRE